MEVIVLAKDGLELTLCVPGLQDGYYRGTRFDHSGIFRRIVKDGYVFADEWFDVYDPYKHDAEVGGVFLKPGVGLLHKDDDCSCP